jgi:NitT/TauT family transport system substrate-binding protein
LSLRSYILALALLLPRPAAAEVDGIATGYQYGLTYLPLMVMQDQHLVEKHGLKAEWRVLSGPAPINDGILSGSLQFGAVGTSSVVTLWAKTRKSAQVKMVGALSTMPMILNTNDPNIKTLKDFTAQNRIALPSVKVGVQAVTLEAAAAQAFGDAQWDKLDKLVVAMAHPEAYVALLSGKSEVSAHFGGPPFPQLELENGKGKIHTVLKSTDVWGGQATFTAVIAAEKFRGANPKAYDAFVKAFEEATAWINAHHEDAAKTYLRIAGSKEPLALIKGVIDDPASGYDLTPHALAKYAEFMARIGTVKEHATSWKELVHPNLLDRPGS